MGLHELRYVAKVDLNKPAAEQEVLHVRFTVKFVRDASETTDTPQNRWHPDGPLPLQLPS